MVNAFYTQESIDGIMAPGIIMAVFGKKHEQFSESKDENFDGLAALINTQYDWRAIQRKYVTSKDIEREINRKHPVIIAFDARLIPDAPFIEPKPDYHVAVIVGYDNEKKEFMLHDPGLSEGREIRYAYEDVLKANETYIIGDTGEERGVFYFAASQVFIFV